jgi:hypothetical protein
MVRVKTTVSLSPDVKLFRFAMHAHTSATPERIGWSLTRGYSRSSAGERGRDGEARGKGRDGHRGAQAAPQLPAAPLSTPGLRAGPVAPLRGLGAPSCLKSYLFFPKKGDSSNFLRFSNSRGPLPPPLPQARAPRAVARPPRSGVVYPPHRPPGFVPAPRACL